MLETTGGGAMSSSPSRLPGDSSAGRSPSEAKFSQLTARELSRRRKWIYGVLIMVLIVVLFVLSRPATLRTSTMEGQPGGVLASYRDQHGLSQTELGQIDPTSETIRLATLGMRGIAGTTLWWKATQFQMKKDWTSLRATLDQISKLQPHSILVWRYQAWNLSYNVSVAFDDYHDKFYWVIEGLNYMLDGLRVNDKEPRLYWDMGWFISNKVGRDDAAKYYRRLFSGERGFDGKEPPDYVKEFRQRFDPPTGFPPGSNLRDNWHVGKAWFLAAESKINPPRYPVRGMANVIFYSDAPTCQFYYADALEKDGTFGQMAQRAWQAAENEWHAFGNRSIDTSWDIPLELNRREELFEQAEAKKERLDALAPGVRGELESEKRAKLSQEEREIWDKYRADADKYRRQKKNKNNAQTLPQPLIDSDLKDRAEAKPDEIARRSPPAHHQEAVKLAKEIEHDEYIASLTNRERMKVNFDFWRARARAEQTDECVAARKAFHDGDQAYAKGDMIRARPEYEKGLRGWRKVLDNPEFHLLLDDPSLGGDLVDVIRHYEKCLEQDDQDLPDPFILQDVVDKHGARAGSPLPPVGKKKTPDATAEKTDKEKAAKPSTARKREPKSKRS
jgi:hypothetical protein